MRKWIILSLFIALSVTQSLASNHKNSHHKRKSSSIAYVKGTLPQQIFKCMEKYTFLRCIQYFVLLRIESKEYNFPKTGNLTQDFLETVLQSEQHLPAHIPQKILKLSDAELTERLTTGLQKFFKHRSIMLKFIPNVMVKLVPSGTNYLELSLKKKKATNKNYMEKGRAQDESDTDESIDYDMLGGFGKIDEEKLKEEDIDGKGDLGKGGKKNNAYLQVGVPLLLLPGMFFAGFLPMILPVLKFATIFSSIVNHAALIAAMAYFARQHSLEKEVQQTVYFNPGYNG